MIIFDLDTLADDTHRRHFIDPEFAGDRIRKCVCIETNKVTYKRYTGELWQPDISAYNAACGDDVPFMSTVKLFDLLAMENGSYGIQIWTSRCESMREKTIVWLKYMTACFHDEHFTIKMRPIGNIEPAHVLKEGWFMESLHSHIEDKKVQFVFDADPESIAMFRRRGIYVFDCRQV